jgi:hypothetical protein
MSQKTTFIFIICFLCCFACGTKTAIDGDAEVIRLNPHDAEEYVNLSEFADSVRCVKLQVDSGDVMGMVTQFHIKNKYIFAYDYSQRNILGIRPER